MNKKIKSALIATSGIPIFFSMLILCKELWNIRLTHTTILPTANPTNQDNMISENQNLNEIVIKKNPKNISSSNRQETTESNSFSAMNSMNYDDEKFNLPEYEMIENVRNSSMSEEVAEKLLEIIRQEHESNLLEEDLANQYIGNQLSEDELEMQATEQFLEQGLSMDEIETLVENIFSNNENGGSEIERSVSEENTEVQQDEISEEAIDHFLKEGIDMNDIEEHILIMLSDIESSLNYPAHIEGNETIYDLASQISEQEAMEQFLEAGISVEDAESYLEVIFSEDKIDPIESH